MFGLCNAWGLVGVNSDWGVQSVNSEWGVQSKSKCESHKPCICIAGFWFTQDFIQSKEIFKTKYMGSSVSLELYDDDRTKQNNLLRK